MISRLIVFIPLLVFGGISAHPGRCVKFGLCGEFDNYFDTCKVDHPPLPLESEHISQLEKYCPELIEKYGHSLCCDSDQILDLQIDLDTSRGLIGHCPSCYSNLRRIFCEFSCSPDQYKFLNVTEVASTTEGALDFRPDLPPEVVRTVDFFITKKLIEGTFESCKNVMVKPDKDDAFPAMDILCGRWQSHNCTGQRWFESMGPTIRGVPSFNLNYRFIDTEVSSSNNISELGGSFEALDLPTYSCAEVPSESTKRCACTDCPVSCPIAPKSGGVDHHWLLSLYDFISNLQQIY